jgi:AraC family transcriptional regulator
MPSDPPELISMRPLAAGEGWALSEFLCRAGPRDRQFEERHGSFTVAAVLAGQFSYRGERGGSYLSPGALLTGNSGRCFSCAHEHGVGDHCVSLSFSEELAGEAAAAISGRAAFAFDTPSLPPSDGSLPIVARFQAFAAGVDPDGGEDLMWSTLARVVAGTAGRGGKAVAPNGRETRQVTAAIRAIDERPAHEHSLDRLARDAGMSRYHFLRVFRRATGTTPRQYLIQARFRRAAAQLATSREPITSVALDCGFGDLSTFNRRFRAVFGVSPRRFRSGP